VYTILLYGFAKSVSCILIAYLRSSRRWAVY